MTENIFTPRTDAQAESQGDPTLRRNLGLPRGVLQKNLKTFVYLGAALLVIVAALFSSSGKKTPAQQASAKGHPCRLSEQSGKGETVAGSIQRRIPGLCQGLHRSSDRRIIGTSDRRKANSGADSGPGSQEERTRRAV